METKCHESHDHRELQAPEAGSKPWLNASYLPKPRAVLTGMQAIQIFKLKPGTALSTKSATATALARMYGVSEKTVRDIWTRRTWSRETCHLDPTRLLPLKHPGRPKGCKDTKPRKPRSVCKQAFDRRAKEVRGTLYPSHLEPATGAQSFDQPPTCPGSQDSFHAISSLATQDHVMDHDSIHAISATQDHVMDHGRRARDDVRRQPEPASSIDSQLHQWAQGCIALQTLQDPFGNDWMPVSATREGRCCFAP